MDNKKMYHCLTCDSLTDDYDAQTIFFTFFKSNGLLVADVLERCLLIPDLSQLGSDVVCGKCYVLLEDYSTLEIKFRQLRTSLWELHKQTIISKQRDLGEFIRGVEVQTDAPTVNGISDNTNHDPKTVHDESAKNVKVESVSVDANHSNQEDDDDNGDNITIDADPQWHSDNDSSSSQKSQKDVYTCKVCGLKLETEDARQVHEIVFKHGDSSSTKKKKNLKKPEGSNCQLCDESYHGYNELKRHMQSQHTSHRIKFQCHVCNKTLSSHGGAVYHGRTHNNGIEVEELADMFQLLAEHIQGSTAERKPNKKEESLREKPKEKSRTYKAKWADREIERKRDRNLRENKQEDSDSDASSSSDDEVPLATQRKQIIFRKIQKEVLKTPKKQENKTTAKKALAELKKIDGIVIRKVSEKAPYKPAKPKYDSSLHERNLQLLRKIIPNFTGSGGKTKKKEEDGDEGLKEARLPPVKEPRFKCQICDKMWKTRGELNAHKTTHSDIRPFICEMCGQAYKHKHALDVHVGMHKGIYHHQCPYCKKAFTQKGALQRHLPIHTGDMPYQCELCGKRFVHRTSFSIHTMAHTGIRHVRCSICNLGVLSKSHLRRHMRIHSGEKPYECPSCGKAFAERYNLVAHQRIHDPTIPPAARVQKKKQHVCRLCNVFYTSKQKLEDHMVNDHNKVIDETSGSRPSNFEHSNESYIPPRLFMNESNDSVKTESLRAEDEKPILLPGPEASLSAAEQALARRNAQALRNMDLLRATVDGQLVRLSAGMMEPPHGWPYINHSS